MESSAIIRKSYEPSKDLLARTRLATIVIVVFLAFPTLIFFASCLNEEGDQDQEFPHSSTKPQPLLLLLHPLVKNACANTLYPSLCFTTLSSAPPHTFKKTITLHRILQISVNLTVASVVNSGFRIKALFTHQDLNPQEKTALNDCMEMTDQTLYELGQAIDDLHALLPSYSNLKNLLSAAMTNENTCIDGFTDLEEADSESHKGIKGHLQSILTPVSGMISNCLAIIKYMETTAPRNGKIKNATMRRDEFPAWMTADDRKLIEMVPRIRPDIVVAADRSGHVLIFAAIVGDMFLARDLTIINSAGPEKHQAVAVRVTSNSAFYRCNFSSYQDTLYAHSLSQFYRECTIQGTIDFIFGNAAAVFQNCLISVRKPSPGQKNMITAQGRGDPNQNTGISLQNCTIVAAPEFPLAERRNFSTFLGRPWRNYSRTMVMKSYLGDLINPQGWYKWNQYSTLDTVEYIEYQNFGPGSDTRHRVTWGGYRKNCSEDIAKQFTVEVFLHGAGDWLESIGFPLVHGS